MYRLFEKSPINTSGDFVQPGFQRVRTGLLFSMDRVMEYHRAHPRTVNNNHILVRLLDNLNVPLSMDIGMFRDKVADRSLDLAMSLKMTSPLSKGKIFNHGWFFGEGVEEILLANIDEFDLERFDESWIARRSVNVLYHPGTDLNMRVPNGHGVASQAGVAVISINIPLLACQYRAWRKNPINATKTTAQFVSAVPVVNAIPSILDIAVFNNLVAVMLGAEVPESDNRHPFYLVDWSRELNFFLKDWLKRVGDRHWDFDSIISLIPTIDKDDFHDVIQLPEMSYSNQVQWAVVLSRVVLLMFLLKFNADTNNHRNQHYINKLRIYFRAFFSMRGLEQALTPGRAKEITTIVEKGILAYL